MTQNTVVTTVETKDVLLQILEEYTRGRSNVTFISPETMSTIFGVPGVGDRTPRHVVCNAAVYWAEQHGFHLTWMPVMDEAEFRDYDVLMAKYRKKDN